MHPARDEHLTLDFPALYRDRHGDTRETRMCDGFPMDGWEPLIRRMSEKIEPFCVATDLHASQVKEKHGILRVYMESSAPLPDEVRAAVARAVEESGRTCEWCGAAGQRRRIGWIKTLCANCLERRGPDRATMSNTKRDFEDRYKPLLARRVPRENIVLGRAYQIHARNGGVGVAVEDEGRIGYRLHRVKFDEHYLFTEYDWADDPNFGTAIPLKLIEAEPPTGNRELLAWLANQEDEHRAEIDAAWEVILGSPPGRYASWKDRKPEGSQ